MIEAQRHRGPDDIGFYTDKRIVLGHRRLAILDLSAAGHQPMSNETEDIWVTYNGEIYNFEELRKDLVARGHSFRSHCDTEVLLHGYEEWGIERLLSRLRGMFAFGLYDARDARLILARDRLGIKPLYYSVTDKADSIAFASEVRAIKVSKLLDATIDRVALAGFLLLGSVPAPRTILKQVQCLPAAHYLIMTPERLELKRYWDLSLTYPGAAGDEANPGDICQLLRDAVGQHLLSDAPLGVFLSGGMDSGAIGALASYASTRLQTVTIGFGEDEFDETADARRAAIEFGAEHHEVRVTAVDFLREIPAILAAMDQPTNDGVNTYFVSKAARQLGLKVVLSGLGGDEVFWGYPHYRWLAGQRPWLRQLLTLPPAVRSLALLGAAAYGRLSGQEKWSRLQYLRHDASCAGLYFATRGFFPISHVTRLMGFTTSELHATAANLLEDILPPDSKSWGEPATFNYLELKRYLHDQLLRDADVFSMTHSIETRVPFLDHELVSQAAFIAGAQKIGSASNKPLLLRVVNHPAVARAATRKKKGFTFPMRDWMIQNLGQLREIATQSELLDGSELARTFNLFGAGRLHWSRAWSLVALAGATQ